MSIIMMKIFFILFGLFPIFNTAQQYVSLDDLRSNFKVQDFTLKTNTLYEFNSEVKIYNVFLSENVILLMSVLPDLESLENWVKIEESAFKDKLVSKYKILSLAHNWLEDNRPTNKTFEYKLLKNNKGEFYVSKVCLTELFKIQKTKYPILPSYGIININEERLKIKEMKTLFERQFPNADFILDPRNNSRINFIDNSYLKKYYLSTVFKIKNQDAYQFWTFDNWNIWDGYNIQRGIDRFVYSEKLGIIGGSYDFYFELKPKSSSNSYYTADKNLLWENIFNEKVMIAEELLD